MYPIAVSRVLNFILGFFYSNHAWVSFHGFSEAYNEYATDMSSAISSYAEATGGLLYFFNCSKKFIVLKINRLLLLLHLKIPMSPICL